MRLAAFKARGFKSFADAVSFSVGGELTGVVGPNGCGKSNIVDAVRWALGESRASSLRGATLSDVMFNGSQKRAPADWCQVELRFDNADGAATGVWSSYPEIIVRRELSRDGRQSYTINNAAVRRRDVVDLFRGTGVAPRAYGVVEQGMVTDIAEASPEELRAFIEEAAGVSHYKERRRDSERRLTAAQDNLAQLGHTLDGMNKRVESLKRQARTARRHRALSEEIGQLDAYLILSRRADAERDLAACRDILQKHDAAAAELQSRLQRLRAAGEDEKTRRARMQAQADEAMAELAAAQQAVAAAEHAIQNAVSGKKAAQARLNETQDELQTLAKQDEELNAEQQTLQTRAQTLGAELEKSAGAAEADSAELSRLQLAREQAQTDADAAREQLSAAQRALEAETVRGQLLAQRAEDIAKRLAAAQEALAQLPQQEDAATDLSAETEQLAQTRAALEQSRARRGQQQRAAADADAAARALENSIAKLSAQIDTLNAMLQEDDWGDPEQRLARHLQIDAGEWSRALDAALGPYAAATVADDIDAALKHVGMPQAGAALVETRPEKTEAQKNDTGLPDLLSVLRAPDSARALLEYWLAGVFAAPDAAAALAARQRLRAGQRIVTADGAIIGRHSLLATGETRGGYDWEQRMRDLRASEGEQTAKLTDLQAAREQAASAAAAEQKELNRLNAEAERQAAALADKRIELNRQEERRAAAAARQEELTQLRHTLLAEQDDLNAEQQDNQNATDGLRAAHQQCEREFDKRKTALDQAGLALEGCRDAVADSGMQRRDLERQAEETARRQTECAGKKREIAERRQLLNKRAAAADTDMKRQDDSALRDTLNDCRERQSAAEAALEARREDQRASDADSARTEQQRDAAQAELETQRQKLGDERVRERELALKVDYLNDALEELNLTAEPDLPQQGDAAEWQKTIEDLRGKRDRLGAINFMADSELRECEGRVAELRAQKDDIDSAIEELRGAIRRIDTETRARLQTMFDDINREFPVMYQRIFDGGEARLEMSGDDGILEAGFELKVRPPGKRLFPVRMLSGGEKAASAAAFIFAILRLNPPPFCILDEVDAPLDDNRSRRFVELLQDISKTVQCLVVTHNKSTISSLPRLIGVTQEEAGASKVVSVTLRDALRAASA